MVRDIEPGVVYRAEYRTFIFEYDNMMKKFMFFGGERDAIENYKEVGKMIHAPYGGRILEMDIGKRKLMVFKKM